MADNLETISKIITEFQQLEGANARQQAIKQLSGIDRQLKHIETKQENALKAVTAERDKAAKERDELNAKLKELKAEIATQRAQPKPAENPPPNANPARQPGTNTPTASTPNR